MWRAIRLARYADEHLGGSARAILSRPAPNYSQQRRYAKKDKKAGKDEPEVNLSFMERILQKAKAEKAFSISELWPPRDNVEEAKAEALEKKREKKAGEGKKARRKNKSEEEESTKKVAELPPAPSLDPNSNTYAFLYKDYAPIVYTPEQALNNLREYADPRLFNLPKASVRLRLELNMTMEKKNRYVSSFAQVVDVPHLFSHKEKRALIAFCATDEQEEEALAAGADFIGRLEMIKKINKGTLRIDEYDFVIAHTDIIDKLGALRGILKKRFPSTVNGALGDNLTQLVKRFKTGIQFKIEQDQVYPQFGVCDTIVGNLQMSNEQLIDNMEAIVRAVCVHRTASPQLGHFIHRAMLLLKCSTPDPEYFVIDVTPWTPAIPTEEEWERMEAKAKAEAKARKAAARGRKSVTALEQEVLVEERRKQEAEDEGNVDESKNDELIRQAA